jgi:hypothetical protein
VTNILFDLPSPTRAAIEDASREGHPPWSFINRGRFVEGIGVRTSDGAQAGSFYGLAADSLEAIPSNARFLAVSGKASDFQNLPDFRELEGVQVYDRVTDKEIRVLATLRSLRMLSICYVRTDKIDALGALRNLVHLHCDDAPTLTRFQFLQPLRGLRTLWLEHLRGLAGSMWTAMRLRTLEPLAALARLQQLHLVNVRVDDGSLAPLTRLTTLRQLRVPNWFRVAEFAALAAFLPTTEGSFHSPWFFEPKPLDEPHYSACKRCGRYALGMTLGKPMKQLCPACDAAKIAKVILQWETLVAAVRPHPSQRRH